MRRNGSDVGRYAVVALFFTALFTAFFSPVLFGGHYLTVAGDGSDLALPFYLVPHGLWEPDIMLGYPWSSNLNGYWDPLFLLHFIPHSFNAYMLFAYVIAAVGAFGGVDALARSTVGGLVAGVSYALGGFMIGHLGHYDIVHPAAWAPYVFWALIAQRGDRGVRPIVLGGVAIALCAVAGQPQVLAYTLIFALAYIVVTAFGDGDRRRYAIGAAATLILGVGLGSIALVPGALLSLQSFRAQASLEYFLAFSLPLWQIPFRLFLPYVVGESTQPLYPFSTTDYGPDPEYSGYVGIITLTLAVIAIGGRRGDRNVLFFALAAAVALILSAGDGFHVAGLTFHIPGLNLFRAQGRHLLEFTLFASILGGVGAAELARGSVSARRIRVALVAIGVALVAAAAGAMHSGILTGAAADPLRNAALFVPAIAFVVTAVLITSYKRIPSPRLALTILALCTIADLSSFAWFAYWRSPVNESMMQPPPAAVALRAQLAQTHQRIFSVAGATTDGIPPNLSLVWGVPAAGGYVQLLLTSPGIFLQLFPQGTMTPALLLDGADRSLDLAAIRYVVIPPDQAMAFEAARPSWRLFERSEVGTILENPNAAPRVRILHRVVAMSPDDALQAIRHGSLDTKTVATIQRAGALDTPADPSDATAITNLDADDMRVEVTCRTRCFLETSDNYNSMWTASVDGIRTPLLPADYTLRGIFIDAGTHVAAFAYRPWITILGGAVSLISALIMVGLLVVSARSGRRRTAGA